MWSLEAPHASSVGMLMRCRRPKSAPSISLYSRIRLCISLVRAPTHFGPRTSHWPDRFGSWPLQLTWMIFHNSLRFSEVAGGLRYSSKKRSMGTTFPLESAFQPS